jgi:SAM-dependent methyltransferase
MQSQTGLQRWGRTGDLGRRAVCCEASQPPSLEAILTPSSPQSPPAIDWSIGHYERTAAQLYPAARVLVDHAAPAPGERVVDVGCGTGNAALLAAARGAVVTGVDPASRLLGVARERARAEGLDVTFVGGEAQALPVPDASADLVLSVFGVIFAADPGAAAAELARITAPTGRVVLSAWIPEGAIVEMVRVARETTLRALGISQEPVRFAWHDRDALAGLLAPHGFEVGVVQERIAFVDESPRAFVEGEQGNHPLAVAGRAVLEPRGELDALRERLVAIVDAANEDPAGFRVTSRYVVATARRAG